MSSSSSCRRQGPRPRGNILSNHRQSWELDGRLQYDASWKDHTHRFDVRERVGASTTSTEIPWSVLKAPEEEAVAP